MGVDVKRKTNGFWNFNVDLSPCPVCNLIYACIPLGFSGYAGEGFFVNDASSVRSLIRASELPDLQLSDTDDTFAAQLCRYLVVSTTEKPSGVWKIFRSSGGRAGKISGNTVSISCLATCFPRCPGAKSHFGNAVPQSRSAPLNHRTYFERMQPASASNSAGTEASPRQPSALDAVSNLKYPNPLIFKKRERCDAL